MRLGVFGGTFDPVHYGHLLLAETCREACQLDELWFVPTATAPHKQDQQSASAEHRVSMLQLALGGHPQMRVSTIEVDRGGLSYTVDTLAAIGQQTHDAELFLLMGADSLNDLPTWRRPAEICDRATLVVVVRGGMPAPDFEVLRDILAADQLDEIKANQVPLSAIELSSTEIRERVAQGRSIRYRTPRSVEKYIQSHALYVADT